MEQRHAVRYELAVSVVFFWESPGSVFQGEGVTRDISSIGAFIRTPTCPPLRAAVRLQIFLPSRTVGKSLNLATEGQVIRIEHSNEQDKSGGFAVVSKELSIMRWDDIEV